MAELSEMRKKFFTGQRSNIESDLNKQGQVADDAIKRRFAAIGQSGSGAQIGTTLQAQHQIGEQRQKANEGLAGQELQAQIQAEDVETGRKFQSEREDIGRKFQGEQADIGRRFQSGLADQDRLFKRGMFDIEQGNKLKEMDLAQKQFELDRDTTEFNKRMAEIGMQPKPNEGFLNTGLYGDQGFLGTGLTGKKGFMGMGRAGDAVATMGMSELGRGVKNIVSGGGK